MNSNSNNNNNRPISLRIMNSFSNTAGNLKGVFWRNKTENSDGIYDASERDTIVEGDFETESPRNNNNRNSNSYSNINGTTNSIKNAFGLTMSTKFLSRPLPLVPQENVPTTITTTPTTSTTTKEITPTIPMEMPKKIKKVRRFTTEEFSILLTEKDKIEQLLIAHARPIIANYSVLIDSTQPWIDLHVNYQSNERHSNKIVEEFHKNETTPCVFITNSTIIQSEINNASSLEEFELILNEKVELCNIALSARWSLLMSACRRSMPAILKTMKENHSAKMKLYWRYQTLVHTRR